MASFGNKDGLIANGTVTTSNTTNIVTGSGTDFLEEIDNGDYAIIANVKYQVLNVVSSNTLTITSNAASSVSGEDLIVQQGPKWLSNIALEENVYSIQRVYGSDIDESMAPSNRERNIKQTGWYSVLEYTDGYGNKRVKNEVLVSLSKDFKKPDSGDVDGNILVDYFVSIINQPENFKTSNVNTNATFVVEAEGNVPEIDISYQWKNSPNGIVFVDVVDGGVYSGANSNVLSISNVDGLSGYSFKVEVSGSNVSSYVDSAESKIATITIK